MSEQLLAPHDMRVPYASFTPFKVPEDSEVEDEKLAVIADAMSTAYWSVDNAGVKAGDTVIVLGCGPVGLFTQKLCWLGRDHSNHRCVRCTL